jgi:hypothetical protein
MPPLVLRVGIAREGRRSVRLWLPLFVLLPLIYVALSIGALVLASRGRRRGLPVSAPRLFAALVGAFHACRGLIVDVVEGESKVFVSLI